jgi:hypothetical protein
MLQIHRECGEKRERRAKERYFQKSEKNKKEQGLGDQIKPEHMR